ncbi:MAG: mechanosensitive ion channel family protein, partial [Croceitalea sp.]|nr:mechanosensitive ion channel family protein [Croceitalea sp.]
MEVLQNYQQHIDNAIDWFWNFMPNIISAILILVVG